MLTPPDQQTSLSYDKITAVRRSTLPDRTARRLRMRMCVGRLFGGKLQGAHAAEHEAGDKVGEVVGGIGDKPLIGIERLDVLAGGVERAAQRDGGKRGEANDTLVGLRAEHFPYQAFDVLLVGGEEVGDQRIEHVAGLDHLAEKHHGLPGRLVTGKHDVEVTAQLKLEALCRTPLGLVHRVGEVALARLLHRVAEDLAVEAFLVAEVVVYGRDVGIGALRDFLNRGGLEPALGKNLACCLQQTLAFVVGTPSLSVSSRRQFPSPRWELKSKRLSKVKRR